ncbi:MAG: hypothetical protein IPO27_12510 [Bacteroidetes bacterium]|nr:hypothetical protein [Bacteroidota bacterium]
MHKNRFYEVNNDIVIASNTTITLTGCTLAIATGKNYCGAKCDISLKGTSYLYACGDMWQGIINNGGTVNITNSSTIEDAIEAVHNQNNGILNITNNTFAGNNTDLFLDQGSYSNMKITGNTFTNAAGPLTKAPYAGIAPAHHIRLNNVTALEIGGATVAEKNIFNRNLLGILATGSTFNSYNNTFSNCGKLQYAANAIPSWTKLYYCAAITAVSYNNTPTVNIGDQNKTNTFTNCDFGIFICWWQNKRITLDALYNTFENCPTSIYALNVNGTTTTNTLNINNNSITKTPLGGIGIRLENLRFNTIANINNNMINQSGFYDAANYGRAGIDIQNYLPTVVRLNVSNNNSRNVATSIMLRNLLGYAKCGNGGGQLNVFENTIYITKPIVDIGLQHQTGINVQNCQFAQLYNNNPIHYTQIPDVTILDLVTGINIEGSTLITLSQNKTENCGRGISFKSVCTGTVLFCNTMTNCWRGAYLDGTGVSTSISDQGDWTNNTITSTSWGNKWDNNDPTLSGNNRVDGSGMPVGTPPLWLYDVNDVAPFMFRPVPSNQQYITPTAVNNTTTDCTAPNIVSDIERERNYGRTVRDSTWNDPDSTYFEITNEDAFFDAANADSTILYQNNNKDAIYQNKYNQLNGADEGRIDDVICKITDGD